MNTTGTSDSGSARKGVSTSRLSGSPPTWARPVASARRAEAREPLRSAAPSISGGHSHHRQAAASNGGSCAQLRLTVGDVGRIAACLDGSVPPRWRLPGGFW